MKTFPSEEEINQATTLLSELYEPSAQLLGELIGKDIRNLTNKMLKNLGRANLSQEELINLLVRQKSTTLFAGSKAETTKLRKLLLTKLADKEIENLYTGFGQETHSENISFMITKLASRGWVNGKSWPRAFVKAAGFPLIYSGLSNSQTVESVIDISPLITPPVLVGFQKGLVSQMKDVLENNGSKTRCVVSLPTGGGKTRVAVEAFIDWMQPRFSEGKYLIWIAQSEELCEQAISCISQMWGAKQFSKNYLRLYRFFGASQINEDDLQGGVLVSSIQQINSRIKNDPEGVFTTILQNTGAMIIDEAHLAVSEMYATLFKHAEKTCGEELFPVCGLTATPGRSGSDSNEKTTMLVEQFEANLIKPDLGEEYEKYPLRYFREKEYLAQAKHVLFKFKKEYTLTEEEIEESFNLDDPKKLLKRLENDEKRNILIIKKLLNLPEGSKVLLYACSVKHANLLSLILNQMGKQSATISADTPKTLRRAIIEQFKEGKLDFLCNYGVLTTGFDAPQANTIALCRPTTSTVLYEQIIGRGMRGPKFGGTPECIIIDFVDNILNLGPPLAYKRFTDYWTEEENEEE